MFRHTFQGAPYVEVFSTQNKTLFSNWRIPSCIRKAYDQESKTYVLFLQGISSSTKMQLPKDIKQSLGLVQPFIVLQIFIPHQGEFSLEVGVISSPKNRRRILFSSVQKILQVTTLLATVPLIVRAKDEWINLCINVFDLVSGFWKGELYRSIESLTLTGTCRLKRIFTLNEYFLRIKEPAMWEKHYPYSLPKQCRLPSCLHQTVQLISLFTLQNIPRTKHPRKTSDRELQAENNEEYFSNMKWKEKSQNLLKNSEAFLHGTSNQNKTPEIENKRNRLYIDFHQPNKKSEYSSPTRVFQKDPIVFKEREKTIVIKTAESKNLASSNTSEERNKLNKEEDETNFHTDHFDSLAISETPLHLESPVNSFPFPDKMSPKHNKHNIDDIVVVGNKIIPFQTDENEFNIKMKEQSDRQYNIFPFDSPNTVEVWLLPPALQNLKLQNRLESTEKMKACSDSGINSSVAEYTGDKIRRNLELSSVSSESKTSTTESNHCMKTDSNPVIASYDQGQKNKIYTTVRISEHPESEENNSVGEKEDSELLYDPQLDCFFEPNTGKYYKLE